MQDNPVRQAAGTDNSRKWRWDRVALTYGLALLAGAVAAFLGMPLPWMLGPFFAAGTASLLGVTIVPVSYGRELGQLVIGLAVGLRFTSATLLATISLLPAMVGATAYVMVYTMLAALWFKPLSGASATTSFFATAAGGVADMAIVAKEKGGDPSAVAMVHALRVSSPVAIVPLLAVAYGTEGDTIVPNRAGDQSILWLAVAILPALIMVYGTRLSPLPNPWLVGPMILGIGLGTTGLLTVPVPGAVLAVAQVMLGAWLGSRFRREVIATLPRIAGSGIAAAFFMIAAAFVGAWGLSALTDLPVTTSFLALAPAAVTEMVITARAMHLDAEIVTAFHVMRIFLVCSTILLTFRLYNMASRNDELKA